MGTPYDANTPAHARIALTSFNPFAQSSGIGFDYNADLTASQAAAQTTASNAAVAALRDNFGIVIRNTAVPHSLRSNPTQNANDNAALGPVTTSHPLRMSTHLFHTTGDVDRLVAALSATVPR